MYCKSDLFRNISPSKDNWIGAGSGISGVAFNFVISKTYARVELYISRAEKVENKFIFDKLVEIKDEAEQYFGNNLTWERLDDKKASRIKCQMDNVSVFNEDDWGSMINFMVESMIKLNDAFNKPLQKVRQELNRMTFDE